MRKKTLISYAQAQLPFQGTGTRALVVPFKTEKRLLRVVGVAGVALGVLYASLVGMSVAEVAAREDALRDARGLAAEVAGLENTYLTETRGITEGYARGLGFVPTSQRVFVTRQAVSYAVPNASR